MTLPYITNKQKEIILFLYRFRFLNRIQIQTLLKNKDHRNINSWLKDLTEKNYINRIYEKSKQKSTLPAKYFLSINGIRYLKSIGIDAFLLKKYRQEIRRSDNFIDKSLYVAGIYLKLLLLTSMQNDSFKFYSQSDFPKDGVIRELLPDFAYVYEVNKKLQHFVGEIFADNLKPYQVLGRIKKYLEYFEDDEDPANIIFICSRESTVNSIEKYVYRYIRDNEYLNANIYTATKDQVEENGMEITLFKKAEID